MTADLIRLATRGSPLALFQANLVRAKLEDAHPGLVVELVIVTTAGDLRRDVPISAFGGNGLFVNEVEIAVLEHRADVAVHSAKDLPSGAPPAGMVLACVPDRTDARDALCGSTLNQLALGATIASGSARRCALLAAHRPDLRFVDLRGNIATRLAQIPTGGAVVVAMAALRRLDLTERADQILDPEIVLPQVGQGAIALRCREEDAGTAEMLGRIDDVDAHQCVLAERAFLARLGGGCDAPVGAHATVPTREAPTREVHGTDETRHDEITLDGVVAAPDGSAVVRRRMSGRDPEELGRRLADEIAADGVGGVLVGAVQGQ